MTTRLEAPEPLIDDTARQVGARWLVDHGHESARYATAGRIVSLLNRYYPGGFAAFTRTA